MVEIVIRGGTVIDQTGARQADVALQNGVITAVEPDIDGTGATVIDASGCVVAPGLVDLHAHLREPGREEAETIETGSRAAALGGYTAVVAMPNTDPTVDSESVVRNVQKLATTALCEVAVAGSITVGLEGKQLSPMVELSRLGVRMFTDDGKGVQDARLMRRALEYASALGVTLAQHCEDNELSCGGHMHEGAVSSLLGISGMPAEAEEVMLLRDIALVHRTGARMHFMHLSTAGSVAIVAAAKAQGLPVTAEIAPHHFTLTDTEVKSFDPLFKVNPPLRSEADRQALKAALVAGTIDAIATDHAPHAPNLKERPFDEAPCGMLGLETALALAITELTVPTDLSTDFSTDLTAGEGLSIQQILAMLSWQPAEIAGLCATQGGLLVAGRVANVCVIDPAAQWVVDPGKLASKSRNTPFAGRRLRGKVRHTIFRGEVVVQDGEATR